MLFGAVAIRLADATLLDPAEPRRLQAMVAAARPVEHQAGRAPITDRNGEILAVSLPVTALYANPREIENPAEVARRLVRVLPQLDEEGRPRRRSDWAEETPLDDLPTLADELFGGYEGDDEDGDGRRGRR